MIQGHAGKSAEGQGKNSGRGSLSQVSRMGEGVQPHGGIWEPHTYAPHEEGGACASTHQLPPRTAAGGAGWGGDKGLRCPTFRPAACLQPEGVLRGRAAGADTGSQAQRALKRQRPSKRGKGSSSSCCCREKTSKRRQAPAPCGGRLWTRKTWAVSV